MRCHHCGRYLLGLRADHESLCLARHVLARAAEDVASSEARVRRSVAALIDSPGAGASIAAQGASGGGASSAGATLAPVIPLLRRRLSYRVVPLRRGFDLLPDDAA